jgi:hypothetical protein
MGRGVLIAPIPNKPKEYKDQKNQADQLDGKNVFYEFF